MEEGKRELTIQGKGSNSDTVEIGALPARGGLMWLGLRSDESMRCVAAKTLRQ